jgi:uncharacterized protein DUF5666
MKSVRVSAVAFAVLCAVAAPGPAAAQAKPKSQLLPNGTVKSVSTSSLVVTSLGMESTFTVDAATQVVGKGIGTKSKAKGNKPSIVDLLKAGDRVSVTYQDTGGTLHASKIEVSSKNAAR